MSLNKNLFTSLIAVSMLVAACTSEKQRTFNKPVLIVNGHELSAGEFSQRLAEELKQFDALMAKDPANIERAKESVSRDFIHEIVVKTWAKKSKVSVSEEELESMVDKVRDDYPDDLSFRKSLANAGIDIDDWKQQLSSTLLERKVFEKIREDIEAPSNDEMKAYFKSNKEQFYEKPKARLKQILVAKEDDADLIRKALTKNSASEELTSKSSETTWIEKGTLEVFDHAFKMRVGSWSPVLKSPYGYHIYRLEERRRGRQLRFEESKDKIRQSLMADREQAAYSSWLEYELKQAKVLKDNELISAIRVETVGDE